MIQEIEFAPDSPLEQAGFETCMGLFSCQVVVFRFYSQFFVRSGERPFFVPSPTIRFPEARGRGQGTETL